MGILKYLLLCFLKAKITLKIRNTKSNKSQVPQCSLSSLTIVLGSSQTFSTVQELHGHPWNHYNYSVYNNSVPFATLDNYSHLRILVPRQRVNFISTSCNVIQKCSREARVRRLLLEQSVLAIRSTTMQVFLNEHCNHCVSDTPG